MRSCRISSWIFSHVFTIQAIKVDREALIHILSHAVILHGHNSLLRRLISFLVMTNSAVVSILARLEHIYLNQGYFEKHCFTEALEMNSIRDLDTPRPESYYCGKSKRQWAYPHRSSLHCQLVVLLFHSSVILFHSPPFPKLHPLFTKDQTHQAYRRDARRRTGATKEEKRQEGQKEQKEEGPFKERGKEGVPEEEETVGSSWGGISWGVHSSVWVSRTRYNSCCTTSHHGCDDFKCDHWGDRFHPRDAHARAWHTDPYVTRRCPCITHCIAPVYSGWGGGRS